MGRTMSNVRAQAALISGLVAWATFGVMVVAPWFVDDPASASRLLYALLLMPVILAFAVLSFSLAQESNRMGRAATRVSVAVAAAVMAYFFIPWFISLLLALVA
jgi:hypothetical protein